jgi:hypothetical protein
MLCNILFQANQVFQGWPQFHFAFCQLRDGTDPYDEALAKPGATHPAKQLTKNIMRWYPILIGKVLPEPLKLCIPKYLD